MTNDQIRTETLTDEKVADVCRRRYAEAEDDGRRSDKLERIVVGVPGPVPAADHAVVAVHAGGDGAGRGLMKARELDWYGQSLDELREARGVIVHKKGINK